MEHEHEEPGDATMASGEDTAFCEQCVDMFSRIQRYLVGREEADLAERAVMISPKTDSEAPYPSEYEEELTVKLNGSVQALRASVCGVCRLIGTAIHEQAIYEGDGQRALETQAPILRWNRDDGSCADFDYRFEGEIAWSHLSRLDIGISYYDSAQFCPPTCDFDLVRDWISRCVDSHGLCRLKQQRPLRDLRVIDCSQRIIVPAPGDCQYVALSYVWGDAGNSLLQETSKLPTKLPATIEDSITATLRLGYRYLWVDKYCVHQQDSSDKHIQIQQMDIIYASAQITLIAAAGEDCAYGLPGVGRERRLSDLTATIGSITLTLEPNPASLQIVDSKWSTRAWTLQEGFLSRRRLCFTAYEILFICKEFTESENDLLGFDPEVHRLEHTVPQSTEYGLSRGTGLLEVYSPRTLSFQSDALNAILGILKSLRTEQDPIGSVWGVPFGKSSRWGRATDFRLGLYWGKRESSLKSSARRRHDFPSWSPLAWEGTEITFRQTQYPLSATSIPALWEQCDRQYSAMRGFEVSRDLLLTVHVVQMSVKHTGDGQKRRHWLVLPLECGNVDPEIFWDDSEAKAEEVESVMCIFTVDRYSTKTELVFILIEPSGEKYKRKGISETVIGSSAELERWSRNQVRRNIVLV